MKNINSSVVKANDLVPRRSGFGRTNFGSFFFVIDE